MKQQKENVFIAQSFIEIAWKLSAKLSVGLQDQLSEFESCSLLCCISVRLPRHVSGNHGMMQTVVAKKN